MNLSFLYAFTAQARYITIATLTTSKTWTWKPPMDTILYASLMKTGFIGPNDLWDARMARRNMDSAYPNCERIRKNPILRML